jgi:hypothetical protein
MLAIIMDFEISRHRIELQYAASFTMGEISLRKYQEGSEAKLCKRSVQQEH